MFRGSVNSVQRASRRGITHGREAKADRLLSLEVSYHSRTHSRSGDDKRMSVSLVTV